MMTQEKKRKWDTIGILLIVTIIILCWSICVLSVPASANNFTIQAENIDTYSFEADPGYVIYQIIIDPLPMGTNQTHVLNSNGATFLLVIESWQDWFIYNNFNISMTYPNGTIETIHKTTTRVSGGNYKTTIQPVFSQIQSVTNIYWTIDLQVGLTPVTAEFNTPPMDYNQNESIPFSSASGEFSGEFTNVFAEEISIEDFENRIVHYDPLFGVTNLASQILGWTWETVLAFIGMIPVIGPQILVVMVFVYSAAAELIFWFSYVITNFWLILAGCELLIIMFGFLLAGKHPKPEKFIKNVINYNVSVGRGFLWVLTILWGWLLRFAELIARIVRG